MSFDDTRLPEYLRCIEIEIKEKAQALGLDFPNIIFELLDSSRLNEVAAYGGFPKRYPHWSFGMEFDNLAKGYRYGLAKIYELVINNDPVYAYLMKQNSLTDQKLVMAHVCGHADFFKNNAFFSHTNRKMLDKMANNATKVERIMDKYGRIMVEEFIDRCRTLDNLIDIYSPYIKRKGEEKEMDETKVQEEVGRRKLRVDRSYMDDFINPKEYLEYHEQAIAREIEAQQRVPREPVRDVLGFLIEHAPLKRWQRVIMEIVREEAYYFAPQGMTKIINEGWASFWHTTMMTTSDIMEWDEAIHYANCHAGTVSMSGGRINPYKIGLELFRDIEDRWNRGRFGREYEECDDMRRRRDWDTGAMLGREKIFEVRRVCNDVTFIDNYLTEDFCKRHKLFVYGHDRASDEHVITSREFEDVKQKFLDQLVNFGQPVVYVEDANHKNRGELLLVHKHDGYDLKVDEMVDVLKATSLIWGRTVHLRTRLSGEDKVYSHNGKSVGEETV